MPRARVIRPSLGPSEDQLGLFPPVEPVEVSRPSVSRAPTRRPRWTKYRTLEYVACDHCVLRTHVDRDLTPIRAARYRRVVAIDGVDEVLCHGHAQLQRELDGLQRYESDK